MLSPFPPNSFFHKYNCEKSFCTFSHTKLNFCKNLLVFGKKVNRRHLYFFLSKKRFTCKKTSFFDRVPHLLFDNIVIFCIETPTILLSILKNRIFLLQMRHFTQKQRYHFSIFYSSHKKICMKSCIYRIIMQFTPYVYSFSAYNVAYSLCIFPQKKIRQPSFHRIPLIIFPYIILLFST